MTVAVTLSSERRLQQQYSNNITNARTLIMINVINLERMSNVGCVVVARSLAGLFCVLFFFC